MRGRRPNYRLRGRCGFAAPGFAPRRLDRRRAGAIHRTQIPAREICSPFAPPRTTAACPEPLGREVASEDVGQDEETCNFVQGLLSDTVDEYAGDRERSASDGAASEACLVLSSSKPSAECRREEEDGEALAGRQRACHEPSAGRARPRRRTVVRETPPVAAVARLGAPASSLLLTPPALPVGSPAISLRRHRREAARAAIAEVEAYGAAVSAMSLDLGDLGPPVPRAAPVLSPPVPSEAPPFRPASVGAFGAVRVLKRPGGGPLSRAASGGHGCWRSWAERPPAEFVPHAAAAVRK